MRREGRQHGWVYAFDGFLVDPDGKRRAVHAVDGRAAGNGGLVRAPRKPTNHSKFTGGRAYKHLIGKDGGGATAKGVHKFKHDELKTYRLELLQGADDDVAVDDPMGCYDD
ncbi:hypothetical protein ACP4OV_024560 [Aristida adscensionis]